MLLFDGGICRMHVGMKNTNLFRKQLCYSATAMDPSVKINCCHECVHACVFSSSFPCNEITDKFGIMELI